MTHTWDNFHFYVWDQHLYFYYIEINIAQLVFSDSYWSLLSNSLISFALRTIYSFFVFGELDLLNINILLFEIQFLKKKIPRRKYWVSLGNLCCPFSKKSFFTLASLMMNQSVLSIVIFKAYSRLGIFLVIQKLLPCLLTKSHIRLNLTN